MKIYVMPADVQGCGHYRLIWPARVLQSLGYDVTIVDTQSADDMMTGSVRDGKLIDVKIPKDADVMVFQRVTNQYMAAAIRLIQEKDVAVVIDMDDDLANIHPSNPAFGFLHPRGPYPEQSWMNAARACDDATMVVTATPALIQRYARHGRGRVFDNYVPGRMLDIPHEDNDLIGWAGSVHSHPDDLQAMGPSVNILARGGYTFGNVGSGDGIHKAWGLSETTEIYTSGIVPIEQWGEAVTVLGIGVAPLADTVFNAAKSWLKMAEYAAVGVPCIASPRAEYTRLHKHGVGLLAKDPGDWKRKMKMLAENTAARRELSEQGRDVMAGMTIEGHAWRLMEIWTEALRIQRKKALGAHSRR